ncbi:MAG: DUF1926 domain-containing protein [Alphaproteobacteria bacterium]|nr:DUF1926 domain-containing protein [Alphaproteobacteria bacterium]
MPPLNLSLVIHDQLAPGERESRVARAGRQAWRPLVECLVANAHMRVALHLSGALTEWLDAEEPSVLDALARLVERDQVEILSGSPVGAALQGLPERDAAGHLQATNRWAEQRLGATVRGAWLGAGGWDGIYPRILAKAGVHYALVDRALLAPSGAGFELDSTWYVAEREGAAVGLLPLDSRVAALVPWALPRYLGHELKARAAVGEKIVVAAVGAEALGLAHGSQRWCWGSDRAWMPSAADMLKRQASWLRMVLPGRVAGQGRPTRRVYPLAGTPFDLGADALPPGVGRRWSRIRRDLDEGEDPVLARLGSFMAGPPWEAFLARRDEVNQLHKHMLRVSGSVQRLRRSLRAADGQVLPDRVAAYERARGWLYSAQAGAVLHGGPTGGIDRPDLRHAAWTSLLRAHQSVRTALGEEGELRHQIADYDCDGFREVHISGPEYAATVRPAAGGSIGMLGFWDRGNIANVVRRVEEPWHDHLSFSAQLPSIVPDDSEDEADLFDDDEVLEELTDEMDSVGTVRTDFLERVRLPEPPPLPTPRGHQDATLARDNHPRLLFQEHFLGPGTRLENLRRDQHPQQGDFLDGAYTLLSAERVDDEEVHVALAREGVVDEGGEQRLVRVHKRYVFHRDTPVIDVSYEVSNRYREPVRSRFAVELNIGLDGQLHPERFIQSGDRRALLDRDEVWESVTELSVVMPDQRVRLNLWTGDPATLYFYAVRGVVRTCEGYEPVLHGTCLVLAWDLSLWGEEKMRTDLFLSVERA